MRFPVAALMIGLGYAFVYWALMRIFAFGPSDGSPQESLDHAVARLDVLLGLPGAIPVVMGQPPVHLGQATFATPSSNTPSPNTPSPNSGMSPSPGAVPPLTGGGVVSL